MIPKPKAIGSEFCASRWGGGGTLLVCRWVRVRPVATRPCTSEPVRRWISHAPASARSSLRVALRAMGVLYLLLRRICPSHVGTKEIRGASVLLMRILLNSIHRDLGRTIAARVRRSRVRGRLGVCWLWYQVWIDKSRGRAGGLGWRVRGRVRILRGRGPIRRDVGRARAATFVAGEAIRGCSGSRSTFARAMSKRVGDYIELPQSTATSRLCRQFLDLFEQKIRRQGMLESFL